MTFDNSANTRERVFETDDDLFDELDFLLQRANRRQMWLVFLDDDQRFTGPFMPLDGYPDDPDAPCVTDDLGELTPGKVVMHRSRMLCETVDAASIVLVWERLGPDLVDDVTRRWAAAMAAAARELGVRLRAQFMLHDEGIRQLQVDDYLA